MPSLETHKDFERAFELPFCYLCGKTFASGERKSKDHVPPKAVFAKADRNPPLILPVHPQCNSEESGRDELIGQLIQCLRGVYPRDERLRLAINLFGHGDVDTDVAGVQNLPFIRIAFRWVRGFHAALYREYVPDLGGMIHAPMPEYKLRDDGRVHPVPDLECRPDITRRFKEQLAAGRTDGLVCFNGKCQYRCTWLNFDSGEPFCLFGLRIYNWEDLGGEGIRGCVGWYRAKTPEIATQGTRIRISIPDRVPLDPFSP